MSAHDYRPSVDMYPGNGKPVADWWAFCSGDFYFPLSHRQRRYLGKVVLVIHTQRKRNILGVVESTWKLTSPPFWVVVESMELDLSTL